MMRSFAKVVSGSVAGVLTFGMFASAANAALLDVNINNSNSTTYSGAAVLGASGDTWNGVNGTTTSGTTFSSLVTSTGSPAAGVSFTITGTNLSSFSNTGGGNPTSNALLQDYEFAGSTAPQSITITINGLVANSTYDLVVYGVGDTPGQGGTFVGAVAGTTTGAQGTSFVSGVNYLENSTAVATGGTLTFTTTVANASNYTAVNGFQLSGAVPEPASLGLLSLGSLGLLCRRRSA